MRGKACPSLLSVPLRTPHPTPPFLIYNYLLERHADLYHVHLTIEVEKDKPRTTTKKKSCLIIMFIMIIVIGMRSCEMLLT